MSVIPIEWETFKEGGKHYAKIRKLQFASFPKFRTSASTITYSHSKPVSMIFSEMTAGAHFIFAIHGIE
jgi:hypothetical protein